MREGEKEQERGMNKEGRIEGTRKRERHKSRGSERRKKRER